MIGRARAVERALHDAPSAIAEGRALDTIDELTKLNRRRRDPRLERQLVALRHAAAAELPKAGPSQWPPALDDPFPDEHDLPRIEARQLSGATLGGAITNHGCLRVDHMIDRAAVPKLIDNIERAFAARSRLANGADADAVAPWYVPFDQGRETADGYSSRFFIRLVDSPAVMWEIIELYESMGVVAAVREYFGERPAMIAHKWIMRQSLHGADTTDFHQDGAFLGEGIRTVNCWIALADCGHDMPRPGLEVVPGRFDIIPTGAASKHAWSLAESTVLQAAPDVTVCAPMFGAGDALFFDERTPHRTTNGKDLLGRYAIEAWFVAPSSSLDDHHSIVL